MPGIAGFTVTDRAQGDECQVLVKMRDLMTHHDSYVLDALFFDKWVCATRCHTNVLQKEAQPLTRNEVSVWMDGEFYNRDEVAKEQGIEAVTDPQLLRSLYEKRPDLSLLKHIDGIFPRLSGTPTAVRFILLPIDMHFVNFTGLRKETVLPGPRKPRRCWVCRGFSKKLIGKHSVISSASAILSLIVPG